MQFKSKYGEYDVRVAYRKYDNGRTAIVLHDTKDDETVCTATVNVPEIPLLNGYTFIKDYSENEGVLDFLLENKIVSLLKGRRNDVSVSDYVKVTVVRVLKQQPNPSNKTEG
jgi:hypothetical protein